VKYRYACGVGFLRAALQAFLNILRHLRLYIYFGYLLMFLKPKSYLKSWSGKVVKALQSYRLRASAMAQPRLPLKTVQRDGDLTSLCGGDLV
jgi:hypothetical protein